MRSRFSGVVAVGLVVGTALVALPALAQPVFCPGGGPLSSCAAWVDMDGDRQYDDGDELIGFEIYMGYELHIYNPWECGNPIVLPLMQSGGTGTPFDGVMVNGYDLRITGTDGSNHPNEFTLRRGGVLRGTATLVDNDGDGCSDGLDARLPGGETYVQTEFDTLDTDGDGQGDHISANWTYASLYGMNGSCGMEGGDPQIWVPMDNGQLVPGAPNTYASGCLRRLAPNVPTLSEWGLLLLGIGLVAFGWWLLRQRRALA